jgi:ATP-dependent protease Clp ATPase subunit
MEETDVDLKVPHDPISQIQAIEQYRKTGKREKRTINTRNILFIMSGAFNDLAPIIKKRLQKQEIGFGAQVHSKEDDFSFAKHIKAEDLIDYGFESEFVGRLPVVAVLEPLEVEDLYEILRNPNNPIIAGKKEDFRSYGIDIKFEDEALRLLAEMAYDEKTGARGLVSVIERVLLPFEKSLPSSTVRFLVVTRDVVLDPVGELRLIMNHIHDPRLLESYVQIIESEKSLVRDEVMSRGEHYFRHYPYVFSPDRIELLVEQHLRTGLPIETIMNEAISLCNQIRVFESDYYENYRFRIHFDEEAVNQIIEEALQRGSSATAVCSRISKDFDYGFKLISERSGQTEFTMSRKAVLEPNVYLDELIRESYRGFPLDSSQRKEIP